VDLKQEALKLHRDNQGKLEVISKVPLKDRMIKPCLYARCSRTL